MRGLLMVGAMVLGAASPAAAEWGYAGYANSSFGGYGYGYAGYGNLSEHGAALPHWGDCPCCAGAWDGYCQEKAARAAHRHCNAGTCGHRHFGRKCSADGCNTRDPCGANGTPVDASPEMGQPTPPAPQAPPATPPATPASSVRNRQA